MRYARPLAAHEYDALEKFIDALPERIAQDLADDFKFENFGMIGRRFVKVDYEVLPEPSWDDANLESKS